MKNTKFYVCEKCGNQVGMIHNSGVNPVCCGQKMTALEAGTTEASREKHIPVITREGNLVKVTVGSVLHPMTEAHSITWIYLETTKGGQRKALNPDEAPEASFALCDEEPVAVYAYCNLHGLWKAEF